MSQSRRPSISVHNYPEHLNPFNEGSSNFRQVKENYENKENKATVKESKHKFWNLGSFRKKKNNNFSIKSTWNGLFGKHKGSAEYSERRTTIPSVSTSCKTEQNGKPIAASRITDKDQIEFDEALGTLARRRKYTYDNASRYSSNSIMNGNSGRIYDENPQDTTTSIMGNITPKPPARRFGQVSPRPTDKIPPLLYEDKEREHNGSSADQDREPDRTPVPPKRNGLRASQRMIQRSLDRRDLEMPNFTDTACADVILRDENENVPEDYVFKRFNQDSVRMSNLSINSCISVASTASAYTRKKRRAPQPPRRKETLEIPKENEIRHPIEASEVEFKTVESFSVPKTENNVNQNDQQESSPNSEKSAEATSNDSMKMTNDFEEKQLKEEKETVEIEFRRQPEDRIEIIKDAEVYSSSKEAHLNQKISGTLSRSNSFSVKEEIEKIEKQIKELEAKTSCETENENENSSRQSIEENRRSFFKNMVAGDEVNGVDVKLTELPRVQNEFHIVRLSDSPIATEKSKETVKVIELHISEPIKRKPELIASPVARPRRSSSLSFEKQHSMDSEVPEAKGSKLSL